MSRNVAPEAPRGGGLVRIGEYHPRLPEGEASCESENITRGSPRGRPRANSVECAEAMKSPKMCNKPNNDKGRAAPQASQGRKALNNWAGRFGPAEKYLSFVFEGV